jgi:hypothetical protein
MKRRMYFAERPGRRLGPALALACASLLCTPPAVADDLPTPPVPEALRPSAGERALFFWHANGVQIYECRSAGTGFAWTFVAPEAELVNLDEDHVGTHGAGPFWAASDGSRIVGIVKARADGASAADIPLLLLSTRSVAGSGLLAAVTSVQRLKTRGGVAPASGCQSAVDLGKQSRKPYTADYVFLAAK